MDNTSTCEGEHNQMIRTLTGRRHRSTKLQAKNEALQEKVSHNQKPLKKEKRLQFDEEEEDDSDMDEEKRWLQKWIAEMPLRLRRESDPMFTFQNLTSLDPFANETKGGDKLPVGTSDDIHIRIQQGRETLTTVQGISDIYDKKKLLKDFNKKFVCKGRVTEHKEYGEVIQLKGDQSSNICQFLTEISLAKEEQLKVLTTSRSSGVKKQSKK